MTCDTDLEQQTVQRKKVAVWGSSRTPEDSGLYRAIEEIADLVLDGWAVVTGGGPGNMEAANKGAMRACPEGEICSVAEAITLPFEEAVNEYVQQYDKHEEFFSRLKMFSECDAFVITPGGVGTLLEMALFINSSKSTTSPTKESSVLVVCGVVCEIGWKTRC